MYLYIPEPIAISNVCLFCLTHSSRNLSCNYGLAHEYSKLEKPKQIAKKDLARCVKCDLHLRNPLSQTNGCPHEYAT
jgi:hypothetical protein